MTQAEDDLRTFIHDLLWRDHDRDYRTVAAFPLPDLEKSYLGVLRVDAWDGMSCEAVVGVGFTGKAEDCLWGLIYRGHYHVLSSPSPESSEAARLHGSQGGSVPEVLALGWNVHLEMAVRVAPQVEG